MFLIKDTSEDMDREEPSEGVVKSSVEGDEGIGIEHASNGLISCVVLFLCPSGSCCIGIII